MLNRIQNRQNIARLHDTINKTICVHRRVTYIRRSTVCSTIRFSPPIPQCHNDVSLDPRRSRRYLCWRFTRCNSICPVRKHFSLRTKSTIHTIHTATNRTHLHTLVPCIKMRIRLAQNAGRNFASCLIPDLMAIHAAGHRTSKFLMRQVTLRKFHHGQPPSGRIHLCRRNCIRCYHGIKIQHLPWYPSNSFGIGEPITTHKHLVRRLR